MLITPAYQEIQLLENFMASQSQLVLVSFQEHVVGESMFPTVSWRDPEFLTMTFEGQNSAYPLYPFAVPCCAIAWQGPLRHCCGLLGLFLAFLNNTLHWNLRIGTQDSPEKLLISLMYPRLVWDTATMDLITNVFTPQSYNTMLMLVT